MLQLVSLLHPYSAQNLGSFWSMLLVLLMRRHNSNRIAAATQSALLMVRSSIGTLPPLPLLYLTRRALRADAPTAQVALPSARRTLLEK